MDDEDDSRTSGVGRKRDFRESAEVTNVTEETFSEGALKRVKDSPFTNDAARPVVADATDSVLGSQSSGESADEDIPSSRTSRDGSALSFVVQATNSTNLSRTSPIIWNFGTQRGAGLRTSFGSRSLPKSIKGKISHGTQAHESVIGQRISKTSPQPKPHRASESRSLDSESDIGHESNTDFESQPLEITTSQHDLDPMSEISVPWFIHGKFRRLNAQSLSRLLPAQCEAYHQAHNKHKAEVKNTKLFTHTEAVDHFLSRGSGWPIQDEAISDLIKEGRTLYARLPKIESERYRSYLLPQQIFHKGLPVKWTDLSFEQYIVSFLTLNQESIDEISANTIDLSFKHYVTTFYGHVSHETWPDSLLKSIDTVDIEAIQQMVRNHNKQIITSREPVEHDDGMTKPATQEHKVIVSDDEAEQPAYTEAEQRLYEKYFPGITATTQLCFSCSSSGHRWSSCPAFTCDCAASHRHSARLCPSKRPCGKCRVQGHSVSGCVEKLYLEKSEGYSCMLCGGDEHIEPWCHNIWRSFNPQDSSILRVRDIPIFCYCCGDTGHYGTECGLRQRASLSGGVTWSKVNYHRYIDKSSDVQALSAGVDYSMNPRKLNNRTKASSHIEDASDDDHEFIRPSVTISRTSGNISFAPRRSFGKSISMSDNDYRRGLTTASDSISDPDYSFHETERDQNFRANDQGQRQSKGPTSFTRKGRHDPSRTSESIHRNRTKNRRGKRLGL